MERATKIHCGGISWDEKKMGSLHQSLHHLPLNKKNHFYCSNGVANLMSLSLITNEFDVFMDTQIDNAFYVFNGEGTHMHYRRYPSGLYCYDIEESAEPFSLLSTVEENRNNFSAIDVKRADLARDIQNRLCLPSDCNLAAALEDGTIQECGITRQSVRIANEIYGPNEHSLFGKTVQQKKKMPSEERMTDVSPEVLEYYQNVTISVDVMHVNGIAFLVGISHHLNFIQCSGVSSQKDKHLCKRIQQFDQMYQMRKFKIVQVYADGQFRDMETELASDPHNIKLITCDKNAHVERIERAIRFVKESVRGVKSMLPFRHYPKRLLLEIIYCIITKINSIPRRKRPEHGMSPRRLITGNKLIPPPFTIGDYGHGVPGGTSNDTNKRRAFEALYLEPNNNSSGHWVYNITSKKRNSMPRFKGLSMPKSVVEMINQQGIDEGMPEGIIFGDKLTDP